MIPGQNTARALEVFQEISDIASVGYAHNAVHGVPNVVVIRRRESESGFCGVDESRI